MKRSLREFAKAQEAASQADVFSADAVAPKRALFRTRNIVISVLLLIALSVGGYFLWVELTKTPLERMQESLKSYGVVLNEVHSPEAVLQQCFATEKKIGYIMAKQTPPDKVTVRGTMNGKDGLLDLECNKDTQNSIKSVTVVDSPKPQG